MSDIGYLAALLGGVLALLSPCSAMLLPAFFAYAFQNPQQLLARTGIFYFGLAAVLVPLGAGSSVVAGAFFQHRDTLILVAGWSIIALGAMQLVGKGFTFGPAQRLMARITGDSALSVLALGAVYGLAGFCSGPILGGILTVAATSEQPATGGALLAVYALGMTAPLLLLALVWDRWRIGQRRWLRGRQFSIGRLHLHTTSTVSGLLFVALGVLFLVFDGTAGLAGGFGLTDIEGAAQEWVTSALGDVPDLLVLLVAGLAAVTVLVRRRRRTGTPEAAAAPLPSATDVAGVTLTPSPSVWPARRWTAAAAGAVGTTVVIAVPTDLIDTPYFSRDMAVTWWAWPVLVVTAVLSGLLLATYVAPVAGTGDQATGRSESRTGVTGAALSLFAVGCPVCNKLVLIALGYSGAMSWFAPAQPILATASIALLAWALRRRLAGERVCPAPAASAPLPADGRFDR
ncbi:MULTISPECIES: cytochrome c biogenesis CcdA family protein [unclassified Micromonospora]|uniref:cytochrome c biogenesis CcdA family protein n=1 Tax=unclassified Micromonospora TaxID=2617518 RepID=UPI001C242101|nr:MULTISPECIES: cytochrome c biogenesis CcdA family protein [unclassified Micromonospora]MBU8860230.1 cytochrome c biogenesis CcdA family protein [Micromonospora sp. WMMB482]MDM4779763.1 cytochrome c biogenesis CcdA family protein [Micromonospora sp. b486]